MIKETIEMWKSRLGLERWDIIAEEISRDQVVFPKNMPKKDKYFVGIEVDRENLIGVIYHDRELTEGDIIHELLHVGWETATEDTVNRLTELFLNNFKTCL